MTQRTNEYDIIPATLEHAIHIGLQMREDDVQEVWASYHLKPRLAIIASLALSGDTGYTGTLNGVPVCIFGVARSCLLVNERRPWMLSTDELLPHFRHFLRGSKRVVADWIAEYPYMANYVDERNTISVRWLSWLGFTIYEAEPYGIDGLPFHRFEMEQSHV